MNLIFGLTARHDVKQPYSRISQQLEHIHRQTVRQAAFNTDSSATGYLADDGRILGQAGNDNTSLILAGAIHLPLPGWHDGSPLDNPDATAAFLLDRYHSQGLSFLDGVQGQYAIAINDGRHSKTLLACDPGGMRTFYYHATSDQLVFSTNLAAGASCLPDGPVIDRAWEDFFLIYGFYPWNRTPYRDAGLLPAGTILTWCQGQTSTHPITPGDPWTSRKIGSLSGQTQEADAINTLYDAFMAALEDQAATEDKAAVLPGGVDSALVAAGLCRLGKQVETFSFDYTDGKYNQPHTDTVAKHLGITHNWIPVTGEMIATGLENFRNEFNAPTNWPNYVIQTKVVCEEIRQRGYYYCYSGDGCDTIFLGYPGTHRRTSLLTRLPALPDWLVNLLLFLTAIKPLERRTGHPYRVLLNIIRSLKRKMPERGHVTLRIFDEISLAQLREGPAPEQAMDTEDILEKLAAPLSALSPIRLGYHGKSLISPNKNKIIGSSDNTGVVIHSPYLHPGLKQLAASMSDTLNRPREKTAAAVTGKYILLRMAEEKGLLPREVIYQKKLAAVAAPIDDWYMGPLKNRLMKILQDLPFETSQNYLDSLFADKLAERLYRDYLSPSMVTSDGISLLTTYAGYCGLGKLPSK